jgi:hypothetical protein
VKLSVDVWITEKLAAYETGDVARCKLEVEVPLDRFEAKRIQRALDDVLDDVTNRVTDQLRAAQRQRESLLQVDDE